MDSGIFDENAPFRVTRIGGDDYELAIPIPTGEKGFAGRACPVDACAPGYFQVKLGTGITVPQDEIFCPYCCCKEAPSSFTTDEQEEYVRRLVETEAVRGINRMLGDALGVGPSSKRVIDGGLISIEMSMRPAQPPLRPRLVEEELRRDIVCPHCTLHHAVFGLATWCSDCGADIFTTHVAAELAVLRKVLGAVEDRRATLGARVAARDIENSLEDLVSVTEAVLKALTRRHLLGRGASPEEADGVIARDIRNGFQTLNRARELFRIHTGADLGRGLGDKDFSSLAGLLEKRHPIAHNLGVVDRQYLQRVRVGELEGREVRIGAEELLRAIDLVEPMLVDAWSQLFATT